MASLTLTGLSLTYPNGTRAVDKIHLAIADGEFLAVLGPSGCGKSSLLRLVAGLETPTDGTIAMDGREVTALEPKERDVAMVFQGLALYPHMTVSENMSFGLMARKTPAEEIGRRVREAAETLGLKQHLAKRPRELSGGERQRVALGRALVRRPKIFLFDEPLSSLDAQLRQELREELARLHRITRTTSIYVTHDQKEALSLGDKVAVMRAGTLRQLATPEDVYRNPHDLFVARFVGEPGINLIEGEIASETAGGTTFRAPGFRMTLNGRTARPGPATLGLRSEAVAILSEATGDSSRATVDRVEHLGGETLVHLRGEWGSLVVRAPQAAPAAGARVGLRPDPARALLFDPSGSRI
ncbi:MAG: ABC transporter ATP-binding protein [Candidatus Eisenbacteria bacterium]|uniref:ABC transporter ATP-binding protein n=1 Tax=Eiseniibacteriota bacterium TaxID=2212470 RepID=A0A538TTR1_UNCEI|nr:MAG: ABC transporter ATP-binding protein [Candidatus Eisenbacteria bacterium]